MNYLFLAKADVLRDKNHRAKYLDELKKMYSVPDELYNAERIEEYDRKKANYKNLKNDTDLIIREDLSVYKLYY